MSAPPVAAADPIGALDADREMDMVRTRIASWLDGVDEELREPLASAFAGKQKGFRPLTLFAAYRGVHDSPISSRAIEQAFAVELVHNMSLVIDDVLDESALRRGVPTLHSGFGRLPALMASGYLVADAFAVLAEDPFACRHVAELLRRLASAECMQWRLRREPLGTEDWRRIAGEDTGSMFEICAVLGGRSQRLRRCGHLIGVLYHGCDDVADQRGVAGLGGGGEEDIRDGILTLPAAIAIRDRRTRELFVTDDDDEARLAELARAFRSELGAAERELDHIAEEACTEARLSAEKPEPLIALIGEIRHLSSC
jgi:geranylgeranyl pyrophosphate synthase